MNPAHAPAIRAESLVKDFFTDWRGHRWRALDGVDFTVPVGSVCGLVGPNGSGKSTTLKILAGLTRPNAGRAEILGRLGAEAVRLGRVGYLPDSPALPVHLTGCAFLVHLARLSGLTPGAARDAAGRALEGTDLAGSALRRISEYSKGMRQRLGLAQAVLNDPDVVLLDEPVSGLDPRATEQFGRIVRDLGERRRTVLLTSHFLPQVEELCDQIILLERGRVLFSGEREEVRAAGGLHRLYLERTSP
jgi:ABC-2 type transport system ATP-binding protein